MIWPAEDQVPLELRVEVLAGLPDWAELVDVLRPAARALWLLGYRVEALEVAEGQGAGATAATVDWQRLSLADLTTTVVAETWDRPEPGLTAVLVCDEVVDLEGEHGSFAVPTDPGTGATHGDAPPIFSVSVGSVTQMLDGLAAAVDDFVDSALARLETANPGSGLPGCVGGRGLLWTLLPDHWDAPMAGASARLQTVTEHHVRGNNTGFLKAQMTGRLTDWIADADGTAPNLLELVKRSQTASVFRAISDDLRAGLRLRHELHRLPVAEQARYFAADSPFPWLDAVAGLMALGVVELAKVLPLPEPPEPIVAEQRNRRHVRLSIWGGDETIDILRLRPTDGYVEGSVAWDYHPGSETTKPRVVIVAGRGIHLQHQHVRIGEQWELAIFRVQDDSLVPGEGTSIDPTLLLAPSVVTPHTSELSGLPLNGRATFPPLLHKPTPDGAAVVFPAIGQEASQPAPNAIELEINVDPASAHDAFGIDVHFYDHESSANTRAAGAHVVVWATQNVTIKSPVSPYQDIFGWPGTVNGQGVIQDPEEAWPNVFKSLSAPLDWLGSVEVWRVEDPADIPPPFFAPEHEPHGPDRVRALPVTDLATVHPTSLRAEVPRTTERVPIRYETLEGLGTVETAGGVVLYPASVANTDPHWAEDVVLDAADLVVSLVPYVGASVDLAEFVLAWNTGRDRWGRPVGNFQLGLMGGFALIPFLGPLVRRGSDIVLAPATAIDARPFGDPPLRVRSDYLSEAELASSRRVEPIWRRPSDLDPAAPPAGEDLIEVMRHPNARAALHRLADELGGTAGGDFARAADLVTDEGLAFWVGPIQTAFARYVREHGPTEALEFVEHFASTASAQRAASAVVRSLGHGLAVARRAAPRHRFPPEAGLGLRAGPPVHMGSVAAADARAAIVDYASNHRQTSRVLDGGTLRPSGPFIGDEVNPAAVFDDMVAEAGTHATSATPLVGRVLGPDRIARRRLSLAERAGRFVRGCDNLQAELIGHGLDPRLLRDPRLRPAVLEALRQYVTRYGYLHAIRHEFRESAILLRTLPEGTVRFQTRMPSLRNDRLQSGTDVTVFGDDALAGLGELKAYNSLSSMFAGAVRLRHDPTGLVTKVSGPSIPQQLVKSQLRLRHWNGFVPGPHSALPTAPGAPGVDWYPVSNVRLFVVDDEHLINGMMVAIGDAMTRRGSTTIDVMQDLGGSYRARQALAEQLPSTQLRLSDIEPAGGRGAADFASVDELYDALSGAVRTHLGVVEAELNQYLGQQASLDLLGARLFVRLRASTEGIENAIPLFWADL